MEPKKLEIELFRYGSLVFGKVLHMDEALRQNESLYEESGFKISSVDHPDIDRYTLWVRGSDKSADNDVMYMHFESQFEAIEFVARTKRGLVEINGEACMEVMREI